MSDVIDDISRINRDYELSPGIHYALKSAAADITALRDKLASVESAMGRGAERFMFPPDGGDPTLAEMVGNMRQQLDAAEARALAAPAESDRLRRALGSMELACERLAALRSDSTYLCMIQDPGAEEALVLLDSARKAARQALKEQTP